MPATDPATGFFVNLTYFTFSFRTINETQQGHKGPNTVTLKLFQPAVAIQAQSQGSKRRAKTAFPLQVPKSASPRAGAAFCLQNPGSTVGIFSFESSRQLGPNQHLSKKENKNKNQHKNLQKQRCS